MGEEKWHQVMQNLFGDRSEEEEEEVDSEHESNPHPNSGCNKIIYCATVRFTISGDLYRVDQRGVYNLTKAFQDYKKKMVQLRAGVQEQTYNCKIQDSGVRWEVRQGTYFQDVVASKYDGGMDAKFEFTSTGDAVFSGKRKTKVGF